VIAADAVLGVDDGVALAQLGQVATMASTLLARSWSRLPRRPVVANPG